MLSPDDNSNQDDNGNILFVVVFVWSLCNCDHNSQFCVFSAVIKLFVVSMTVVNWIFECKVWCELEEDASSPVGTILFVFRINNP